MNPFRHTITIQYFIFCTYACTYICNTYLSMITLGVIFILNQFRQCSERESVASLTCGVPSPRATLSALFTRAKVSSIQCSELFFTQPLNSWFFFSYWSPAPQLSQQSDGIWMCWPRQVGGSSGHCPPLCTSCSSSVSGRHLIYWHNRQHGHEFTVCVSPSPAPASFKDLLFPDANGLKRSSSAVTFHPLAHNLVLCQIWKIF